jgi:CHAT domain-containing protein/Tfp pilus assembly protein PilF
VKNKTLRILFCASAALFVFLNISVSAQDRRAEAEKLVAEAEAMQSRQSAEDSRGAIKKYEAAEVIWREIGDVAKQANSLQNAGAIYQKLGDTTSALGYYDRALVLARSVGDKNIEADTLITTGQSYGILGDTRRSIETYKQALALAREIKDRTLESIAVVSLGFVSDAGGDKQSALNYYNEALPVVRALADPRGESTVLINIGAVHHSLGDADRAIEYFEQALPLIVKLGDARRESAGLNNLAAAYNTLGNQQKAIETYKKSLVIKLKAGDRLGEAITLDSLAGIYSDLGDKQNALGLYTQSLTIARELKARGREASTLSNIGRLYLSQNDFQKSFEYFSHSLPIRREVGDIFGESKTLSNQAQAERGRGNLNEALGLIGQSIKIIESVRASLVSPDLRASYFAASQEYYRFQISLLMAMHTAGAGKGYDALALQTVERSRARGLLDILNEAKNEVRQGVDPALIEREKKLRFELNAKDGERRKAKITAEAAALDKDIQDLSASYQDLQTEIRLKNPRYAALVQPQPLGLTEMQRLLDADTLLLAYSLGSDESFLWVVSQSSLKTFRLPKQAVIESKARAFYDAAKNQEKSGEAKDAAADLGKILLGPAIAELGKKRLAVIADGILDYIPFAALTTSASTGPLIIDHEIVNLPSASVLASLRRDTAGRKPAPKAVAVFADPVFDVSDTRVIADENKGPKNVDRDIDLSRAVRDTGTNGVLPRLPGTRREAATILSFAPESARRREVDFAASIESVRNAETSNYRIIHFATHGLLNSVNPELSGIVLSLVDEKGNPRDGFLRLNEIYNLKMPADLVVLSACQTALGKNIKGEGLVGLTRGFMFAGSPRVVASLWTVDDQATSELMKHFYEGILKSKKSPAAALRDAQITMLRSKRFNSPYFWAGFTIQGEWK